MVTATENFRGPPAEIDKFEVLHDVPLFDEHIGEDGVYYDEGLLRRIAQNNNDRINDTGDYVPIAGWHTDEENDPEKDPPVVGYAGPFYVASFGNDKPRPCIYAKDYYLYKDAKALWRRRPRRSVEMWPEDKPENRFFDPIALLGAETPKRDLGMALTYGKSAGTRKIRYSMGSQATAPAAGNTFVPGTGDRERRRNMKDGDMDQTAQIVEGVASMVDTKIEELQAQFNERIGALEEQVGLDAGMTGKGFPLVIATLPRCHRKRICKPWHLRKWTT